MVPRSRQSKGEVIMSKGAVAPSGHAEASPTAIYPDDLEPELRATLSVLARIETQYEQERGDLILQLRFILTAVVSGGGFGLVSSSPDRPGHDKAGSDWGPEQETGQKIADLGHRRQERCQAHQAAAGVAGLLSFALPHVARHRVARRRSAANRARKAAAARHKLMCRCHPCQERASQWSRPRS